MGELITIKEYAQRNGIDHVKVRHRCERGNYKTARRFGRDWVIDSEDVFIDNRVKTGKYKDWRKKQE